MEFISIRILQEEERLESSYKLHSSVQCTVLCSLSQRAQQLQPSSLTHTFQFPEMHSTITTTYHTEKKKGKRKIYQGIEIGRDNLKKQYLVVCIPVRADQRK